MRPITATWWEIVLEGEMLKETDIAWLAGYFETKQVTRSRGLVVFRGTHETLEFVARLVSALTRHQHLVEENKVVVTDINVLLDAIQAFCLKSYAHLRLAQKTG